MIVHSSHGDIAIDSTGNPLGRIPVGLPNIQWFDLEEYRRYWNESSPDHFDILDLGYWYIADDGTLQYEDAVEDWREEIRRGLYQGKNPKGHLSKAV